MKTVAVTGVSRGLGLAIAERLASDGYRVVGLARTLSDEFKQLTAKRPDQVVFQKFDVSDLEAIPELTRAITKEFGPIYGLVNNAGIGLDGVLATMHYTDIDKMFRTNAIGPILLTKYMARSMLALREGRIVNITSIIASTGFHGLAVYAATKAALEGFTRSLSRELGKMKITVNCVAPGYMETDMTKGLDASKMESIKRRTSVGLAEPSDVAAAVAYLMTADAARTTGTVITVDGGSTA
jgi:3-oxoacyl-[acyl-carrier protein] reductase